MNKRIELSNKIFPIYCGLSMDLVFYIAINTLFLTTVKGLTSSEINLINTVGVLTSLFLYLISYKIIDKIGNIVSIRLGSALMLLAAILFTFSTKITFFIIANILYEVSFVFKCVDIVILNKNLVKENRESEFAKVKAKTTTIYSAATMFATLVSGFLFNVNPYIPMLICILICTLNLILSFFVCDFDIEDKKEPIKEKQNIKITAIIIFTILAYGILFGLIGVTQTNDKLFMMYELQKFLNAKTVSLTISVILFLSRVSRLLSNIIFPKIYRKLKNKMLYIVYLSLLISVLLFIIGKILFPPLIGSILMAIGFLLLLSLRDPAENILSTILLKNTKKKDKEQAMIYMQFTRKFTLFVLSLLATIILGKYKLIHLYTIIIIIVLLYGLLIAKLYNLLNKSDNLKEGR